ncbi:MAG: AAA family ATPase [Bacteroidota bacterium]
MQIQYIDIKRFRGISSARVYLEGHTVLIGDNNAGKSTIFEAIDLVLGPDRMGRLPVVDEHDFYNGEYYKEGQPGPEIEIEVLVTDLSGDQRDRFMYHIEFWNTENRTILPAGSIDKVDDKKIVEALRVKFVGKYNSEEDDFEGDTCFCFPQKEDGSMAKFGKGDKRECGFLYLRALRTGTRALSMERGSLLDIILRIRDIRPKMWEDILSKVRDTEVASDPSLGIKDILTGVQEALREFVPSDWGTEPHLKISDLTREHLRKTLTVFMSTGEDSYHAPFQHQGTGTINTMVLALLSMIADAKKNVIFAMEEPEIAIPPYTQKRIIDSIRKKSTQAIFTSHSPFVLEEFPPSQIILVQRDNKGSMRSQPVILPSGIKAKNYNVEFRLRFSEALLAKRILLTEGATEAKVYAAAARRLSEMLSSKYASLEAMGVAVFDVQSESAIAAYGRYFTNLGKTVFATFDKQEDDALAKIKASVQYPFESPHRGCEKLIIEETDEDVLKEFYSDLLMNDEWPTHLDKHKADDANDIDLVKPALLRYLKWDKGANGAPELIGSCTASGHIPKTIRTVLKEIRKTLEAPAPEI